ncbi:MAG: TonB-dependent receptor [Cyclobacteriaceae bacterium]|nr:TonB-dependent receptor [Cyclobacteriaceae bacterium]
MNRYFFLFLFLFFLFFISQAQEITQSVAGKVKDATTGDALPGANVSVFQNEKLITGTSAEANGKFALTLITGRYRVEISFTGYQAIEQELLVIAGKSGMLEIALHELPTILEEVTVKPQAYSEPGVTILSIEKTLRAPANFFDPVRMLTSYPGIVTTNDQANSISVKGYSPNGVLWRLQGLDIVNPNHTANAGTLSDKPTASGGGVNILSAQLLDKTNFYSGNLPPGYGNALAGIVDMSLRTGSTEKIQYTAQASLIGIDLAAEGPINKEKQSSFLVNYRYSTIGLLSQMGVDLGDETINFQDVSFNLIFPSNKGGNLSIFGFAGWSKNLFDAKPEDEWEEEKDRYTIDYNGTAYGAGFVNQFKPGWASVSLGASVSGQEQTRTSQSYVVPYPHVYKENYLSDRTIISSFLKGVHKISRGSIELGVNTSYLTNDMDVSTVTQLYIDPYTPNVKGTVNGFLMQPYLAWQQYIGKFNLNAGIRYVTFSYNQSDSFEPRLSVSRHVRNNLFTLSYGLTSQWQQIQTYLTAGNDQLPFSKSNQFVLEWRKKFNTDLNIVSSVYYHQLFNVPVAPGIPHYSLINQWEDFPKSNLTSDGKGKNYGIDSYVEQRFYGNVYFMISGSYYQSQFTDMGGAYENTRFNGNFTSSLLAGKEWKSTNKAFGVHARMLYSGGLRQAPIDQTTSEFVGTTLYDYSEGYRIKYPNYFRTDLRVSWRKNKPGYTRTWSIDIQNLTGQSNVAYQYYDTFLKQVTTKYQLGIIPVIAYRVDF